MYSWPHGPRGHIHQTQMMGRTAEIEGALHSASLPPGDSSWLRLNNLTLYHHHCSQAFFSWLASRRECAKKEARRFLSPEHPSSPCSSAVSPLSQGLSHSAERSELPPDMAVVRTQWNNKETGGCFCEKLESSFLLPPLPRTALVRVGGTALGCLEPLASLATVVHLPESS